MSDLVPIYMTTHRSTGRVVFSGPEKYIHTPKDTFGRINFTKMENVTGLAYLTAIEIGNKQNILKLNVNPDITTRGEHNLKFNWHKEIENQKK